MPDWSYRSMIWPMGAEKIAISLVPGLADEIRSAADDEGKSVSGWLADAAQRKLRQRAARQALESYEVEHGSISEDELREVRELWPV